jgi:hypothetical protein
VQAGTAEKIVALVCEDKTAEEACRSLSLSAVELISPSEAKRPRNGGNQVLINARFDDKSLARALKPPCVGGFEVGQDNAALQAVFLPWLKQGGLALVVSTVTAFSCDLTRLLCQSVATRVGLSQEQLVDMEIAIQEAIANGLVHGNLGIDSSRRASIDTFDEHCRLTEERLAAPEYGQRRIFLFVRWDNKCVEFTIKDEGDGYDACMTDVRYSGRGLKLITDLAESVSSDDNGRSITLRFSR